MKELGIYLNNGRPTKKQNGAGTEGWCPQLMYIEHQNVLFLRHSGNNHFSNIENSYDAGKVQVLEFVGSTSGLPDSM